MWVENVDLCHPVCPAGLPSSPEDSKPQFSVPSSPRAAPAHCRELAAQESDGLKAKNVGIWNKSRPSQIQHIIYSSGVSGTAQQGECERWKGRSKGLGKKETLYFYIFIFLRGLFSTETLPQVNLHCYILYMMHVIYSSSKDYLVL